MAELLRCACGWAKEMPTEGEPESRSVRCPGCREARTLAELRASTPDPPPVVDPPPAPAAQGPSVPSGQAPAAKREEPESLAAEVLKCECGWCQPNPETLNSPGGTEVICPACGRRVTLEAMRARAGRRRTAVVRRGVNASRAAAGTPYLASVDAPSSGISGFFGWPAGLVGVMAVLASLVSGMEADNVADVAMAIWYLLVGYGAIWLAVRLLAPKECCCKR